MREGFWIQARTGLYRLVDDHARWIQRPENARGFELAEEVVQALGSLRWDFNGKGRRDILLLAMDEGLIRIRNDGQDSKGARPAVTPTPSVRIQETILLDERVKALQGPLVEAGFEVMIIPVSQRGTIPLRCPARAARPPILVTGKVRDWLDRNPDPMSLGVSLVNVAAFLGHPDMGATVLLRALADPDVPPYDLFWMDISHDGRHHLMLFVRG